MSRPVLLLAMLAAASPAASQTSVRDITEIADISGLTPSPDGNWIAYRIEQPSIDTNRIDADWYIAAADGEVAPVHLGRLGTAMWTDAGVVLPGDAKWTPDGRRLIVRALVDGAVGLWASPIDASGFRPFVTADGDIEAFAILATGEVVTREAPSRISLSDAEETERERGILVDAKIDLAQPLFRGASINGRASTQRFSGEWFDRVPLLSAAPRRFRVRSTEAGPDRAATPNEIASLSPPLAAEMAKGLHTLLAEHDVCMAGRCPTAAARLSSRLPLRDGRTLVTLISAESSQTLLLVSRDLNRFDLLAKSDGLLSGDRSETRPCAEVAGAFFCVEATAQLPPRLTRISFSGARRLVANPNAFPDSDGLLAETIAWQVSGSRASGVLIRPKVPGRLPLFITYYRCGGYLRGGTGDEWPLRTLAAHGIAALCINVLPGGDTALDRYDTGLAAVKAAIAELDRRGLVDASRVGMGGLSFGSEVAMWTAMHSDLLKAVSIASVQIEPSYYWFNVRPNRAAFTASIRQNWKLGPPDSEPDGWLKLSAALNVDKIGAPVLMQRRMRTTGSDRSWHASWRRSTQATANR